MSFWTVGSEYLQYLYLGEKDETYIIKMSTNPTDFLAVPITGVLFLMVGLTLQIPPLTPVTSFIFWLSMMIFSDFIFGFTHIITHFQPYLRKLHMMHHQYKREHLNCFAVFYSELFDAIIMNIVAFTNSFFTLAFSQNTIALKEWLFMGLHSHHKYPTNQLTLIYFFEFELIDMAMNQLRLANYHNMHHHNVDQNYSIFGLVSDNLLAKLYNYMRNVFPTKFNLEKYKI